MSFLLPISVLFLDSHHYALMLTHSDGTCVRDYLHVMDLAKGHVLSLDALAKNVSEGIFKTTDTSKSGYYRAFNLGKGKGMSVLDMINAMKKASGFDFQYEIVGRRCVFFLSLISPSSPSHSSSFTVSLLRLLDSLRLIPQWSLRA
jgi:UDP-glucose 4-epimerase